MVVKCHFIWYGSKFVYRFWDDKNQKILRYCDVIFDENILYKDKIGVHSEDAEKLGV